MAKCKKKVIILGGGIAGLSAAHHLLKRGRGRFEVVMYERRNVGGKARSGIKINTNLPTEHGFRFFPGFYKHVTKTMKEIPLPGYCRNVYKNNLVDTEVYTFLFSNKSGRLDVPINVGTYISMFRFKALKEKIRQLREQRDKTGIRITDLGVKRFAESIMEVYTTCNARIDNNYDNISWSEYIDAKNTENKYGDDYNDLLATGISKNLVAVRADVANARTGAKLIGHMMWHIISPFAPKADKILNAPTHDAWIDPWLKYLNKKGLKILSDQRVVSLEFNPQTRLVEGMRHDHVDALYNTPDDSVKGRSWRYYENEAVVSALPLVQADYYICTMPVERMDEVLQRSRYGTSRMEEFDPALSNFKALWLNTEWMTGVMLYFDTEINIAKGHITIADEDAAVTMISQFQFWTEYLKNKEPIVRKGRPVKAILSVIVSNWQARSKYIADKGVILRELTQEQVVEEVKEIVFRCEIEQDKKLGFYRGNLIDAFLDDSIVDFDKQLANPRYEEIEKKFKLYNKEPLFINKTHSYHVRPTGYTSFTNLFLASDYVKTNADLGCMDSADEAARRAVNNIFRKENIRNYCPISLYRLPSFLGLFDTARVLDYRNFKKGLQYRQNFIKRLLITLTRVVIGIMAAKIPFFIKGILLLAVGTVLLIICFFNMFFLFVLKQIHVTGV